MITIPWGNKKGMLQLDGKTGFWGVEFSGVKLHHLEAAVKGADGALERSTQFQEHLVQQTEGKNEIGSCKKIAFFHRGTQDNQLLQEFCLYEDGTMTVKVTVQSEKVFATNEMFPVYASGTAQCIKMEQLGIRVLSAPFDNDKWAKFVDYPAKYSRESYEFSVIHPADSAEGLVVGSVDHDTWKSAVRVGEDSFQVVSGVASEDTRDLAGIEHGTISGLEVKSARIFLGFFENWQKGLPVYGKANAAVKPALPWEGPVIFGWNSWAALMGKVSFEKYKEASDFMKTLQYTYCGSDKNQYINYDAAWGSFTNKMRESVAYAKANGQMPGTYFSPFITHEHQFKDEVPGTNGDYLFEDLLLRDREGKVLPHIDGLYSLDPTHPGTLAYISYVTGNFIRWGFTSVKTDFVGHACREGDFYKKEITTGVQAFNFGMQHYVDCLSEKRAGYPIFISLSIAPVMPHGYGHARRISCDAFGSLDQSAYLNNCITYLWWMNDCLYRFNDPDHIVTYKTYDKHSTSLEEGITRYHTGVICGSLMLTSDDYGEAAARERAAYVLGNEEVNAVARKGESFYPVSGAQGEFAADVFMRKDGETTVLAVFNYNLSEEKEMEIPLEDMEMDPKTVVVIRDLWTKKETECSSGVLCVKLAPAQSAILKVYQK